MKKIKKQIVSLSLITCMATATIIGNTKYIGVNIAKAEQTQETIKYKVTEESKSEIQMANRAISPYWFPKELLEWNPTKEEIEILKGTIPLAKRVSSDKLSPVTNTQQKDFEVLAISIMNATTSGNSSHGTNQFDANTFSYWQYIDKLVYWGGSSSEGLIVPPSADVIDAAHQNGVPVLGTVFFPMTEHGGKLEWLDDFLQKDSTGSFPTIDKLIETAKLLEFDGWFLNQETQGTEEAPLTKKHAKLMQEWIKQFKQKAGNSLDLIWYDSMTTEGKMDWQNALTDQNKDFLIDKKGNSLADRMFLNFWWTSDSHVKEQLLKNSNKKAKELGINPYHLYAGIDVQANGTKTPIRWNLLQNKKGVPFTSLGLYCPSWTYFSANSAKEFETKENRLWVNENGNPAVKTTATGTDWRGVSTYAIEKTVVNSLPFITNFNMGNGTDFFIDGEKVSSLDWNNRSVMDIMPTYRWMLEQESSNNLKAKIDYTDAYYGGNSINLKGNLEADKNSAITLYSADLAIENGVIATAWAKAKQELSLDLQLEFYDGTKEIVKADKAVGTDWTKLIYDVEKYAGKSIKRIGFVISSKESISNAQINLGNLSIAKENTTEVGAIANLKIVDSAFEEENQYAGIEFSWNKVSDAKYYELYKVNEDNTYSFLGVTTANAYFLNALPREKREKQTEFIVVPVRIDQKRGTSASVKMDWPENTAPKAEFKASKTLVAPGEKITFESLSSVNTEELVWSFPGAEKETETSTSPIVSYQKEGTYTIKLTAKNEIGEDTKTVENLVVVSSEVKGDLANLSEGKQATASSFVNDNEAPAFALDGKKDTKWCAVGQAPHNITIDLGEEKTISEVYIAHAQAGGESADMNTLTYKIETSNNGKSFETVAEINKNKSGETVDAFAPRKARYVKLTIVKPTQGADSAARIYEIEVRGLK